MATKGTTSEGGAALPAGAQNVNVQFVPVGNSDQPVFANLTVIHPGSGVAFLDFGFLDPGALKELSRLARSGSKVPERLNGRLAVRVALGFDALANLHRQAGQVLQAISAGAQGAQGAQGGEQGT